VHCCGLQPAEIQYWLKNLCSMSVKFGEGFVAITVWQKHPGLTPKWPEQKVHHQVKRVFMCGQEACGELKQNRVKLMPGEQLNQKCKQKQSKDKYMKEVNWKYLVIFHHLGVMDAHRCSLTYCCINNSSWRQPTS